MPQAPYRRVHVIVNPASGRDEPVLNVLDDVFRTHQVDWTVSVTHKYGDAADQARQAIEDGFDPIRTLGITAVLDTRAERVADLAFYDAHGITHRKFLVPDVTVPDEAVLTEAVAWIEDQLEADRIVLIHCAKGRGRSATVLAAYLMKTEAMSFDAVRDLLRSKRSLVKLEDRHLRVLESWVAR